MAAVSAQDFISFFTALFNSLVTFGDVDSYKKVADTLSAAARIARQRYRAALAAKAPATADPTSGKGGFRIGTGDTIVPPRPPGTIPAGGGAPSSPYTDGIDYVVSSSWIAGFNFRPLNGKRGGPVQVYSGPRLPSTAPPNKGDLTMITIRASYANSSGRYVYPNIPRMIMDRAVKASSPGKFYHSTLKYYSNRSLIGARMRRTSRRLLT